MRFSIVLGLLALVGCANGGQYAPAIDPGQTVNIREVRNLAGVPLRVAELYLADAGGAGDLPVDQIDIALTVQAALMARVRSMGHEVSENGRFELHAAVTEFDMVELRATGRMRMAVAVMLVDSASQEVVSEGEAGQEYQLLERAPDDAGLLGEQRFIRRRLEAFIESLTNVALQRAGL